MNCTLSHHVEFGGHYVPAGVPVRVLGWESREGGGGWVRCLAVVALRVSDGVVVRDVEVRVFPSVLRFESIRPDSW